MSERFDKKSAIDRALFGNYQSGEMVNGKWVPEVKEEWQSREVSSMDMDLELHRGNLGGDLPFKKALLGCLAIPVAISYVCFEGARDTLYKALRKNINA